MFDDIIIVPALIVVFGASFFFLISSLVGLVTEDFISENKIR